MATALICNFSLLSVVEVAVSELAVSEAAEDEVAIVCEIAELPSLEVDSSANANGAATKTWLETKREWLKSFVFSDIFS